MTGQGIWVYVVFGMMEGRKKTKRIRRVGSYVCLPSPSLLRMVRRSSGQGEGPAAFRMWDPGASWLKAESCSVRGRAGGDKTPGHGVNMGQKVKCFPSKMGVGGDSKHTQQPRMQSPLAVWDKQKQDAGNSCLQQAGRRGPH